MKGLSSTTFVVLLAMACSVVACSSLIPATRTPEARATRAEATSAARASQFEPSAESAQQVSRIGIREAQGPAEFFLVETGEPFVPRGVNYVDFYRTERGGYEDRVLATNVYDPERVRAAFRQLAGYGYNTVRIFVDTCGFGQHCIGNPLGEKLNPDYLDNMVDLMRIAGQEGLYIIFTANSVPEEGGYWSYFDQQVYQEDHRYGFDSAENSDWLHPAGVEIKRRFWQDLMTALVDRAAPFEVVFGWQLTNELWLWNTAPPLNLDEGLVTIANGRSYDMADPDQKRAMVADGILFYMDVIVGTIKDHDPEALTTVGFFAPQFPHGTGIGGEWYVDTAPLLGNAAVDFWDFHAYYDTDLSIEQQAENFGMLGYHEKPILMGETGSGHAIFPSAYTALTVGLQWIADSCQVGFNGWLNWGYYPWPEDLGGKPWTFLEQDGLLMRAMSPQEQPDPCLVPELGQANIALGRPVAYSAQSPDEPASAAVDARADAWSAGDYPRQWIEVDLEAPSTIQQVGMTVSQWPPGETYHQVWAQQSDGLEVLLAAFADYTTVDMALTAPLPIPLPDVTAVRFTTLESPSWAGWREVEVISADPGPDRACLATLTTSTNPLRWPEIEDYRVRQLPAGTVTVLDRTFESGSQRWWRVPGGLWLPDDALSLAGDCQASALGAGPGTRRARVTFELEAPASTTGEVFLGGYFPGSRLPPWVPHAVMLAPAGDRYQATLWLPVGTSIEYVYNRGDWGRIERPASCGETQPRTLTVGEDSNLMQDRVVKWHDLDGCD